MLSVLDHAYLKKAQEHPNYSPLHQKILFILLHEKKYYEKGELLTFTHNSLETLDETLADLQKLKILIIDGWLVKLADTIQLCETIENEENKKNTKKRNLRTFN